MMTALPDNEYEYAKHAFSSRFKLFCKQGFLVHMIFISYEYDTSKSTDSTITIRAKTIEGSLITTPTLFSMDATKRLRTTQSVNNEPTRHHDTKETTRILSI